MKNVMRAAIAASVLFLLAACAGQPEIPYDRSATPHVKTIGLLTPEFPYDVVVVRASSVGQSFGLIGAAIEAGLQSKRENKFKVAIAPQDFDARETFLKSVHDHLKQRGYGVIDIGHSRPDKSLLETYPRPSDTQPVDAYLDLVVGTYGYIAAGGGDSTPYRPTVSMAVKFVNAKTGAVLMQDGIIYNPIGPVKNVVTIAPDPAYVFTDSDALVADPKNAVEGLRTSIEATAKMLGSLLK